MTYPKFYSHWGRSRRQIDGCAPRPDGKRSHCLTTAHPILRFWPNAKGSSWTATEGGPRGFRNIKSDLENEEALENAQVVMLVVPSSAHADCQRMAPYMKDGQIVILNPGAPAAPLNLTWYDEKPAAQQKYCLQKRKHSFMPAAQTGPRRGASSESRKRCRWPHCPLTQRNIKSNP